MAQVPTCGWEWCCSGLCLCAGQSACLWCCCGPRWVDGVARETVTVVELSCADGDHCQLLDNWSVSMHVLVVALKKLSRS
jgi:hypothetical protein